MNDVMSHRRKEKIVRKDFLNLLMQLMDRGELEEDDKPNSVVSNGHAKGTFVNTKFLLLV